MSPATLLLIAMIQAPEPAADFYVAPNGNDAWSGKLAAANPAAGDGPFATLARARDALRQAQAGTKKPRAWKVLLRGGVYRLAEPLVFGPEDSGRGGNAVTWGAFPGEKAVLSGGRPVTGWRKEAGAWTTTVSDASGTAAFHQMFVNGARRGVARHPNEGYFQTVGNLPGVKDVHKDRDNPAGRLGFTFKGDDLRPWPDADQVNVVLYYDWSTSRHWIESVKPADHTVHFTNGTGWPVCYWEKNQRFHLENSRAFLDACGEWHLDAKTGQLTYLPMPGEDPNTAETIAPRLRRLVELRGDPVAGKFVDGLHFEGLSFQHADWRFGRKEVLEMQAAVYCTGAVWGQGVRNARFIGCQFAHLGEYALWLESGCQGNVIRRCEFCDLGAGGVRIGPAGFTDDPNRISRYNVVDNCFIHDAGHVFPDGVGIWIGHSSDNQLTHNEISDLMYSGISVGWSWGYGRSGAHHNLIEWNHVHHLGYGVLSEISAIYTLGVSPGTRICNNLLHDTYDFRYGSWGIGLDEGTSQAVVENNQIYRHSWGIGLNYGHENLVHNNIVALIRGHDLLGMGAAGEGPATMEVRANLFYTNAGLITAKSWAQGKIQSDYNLFWDTTQKDQTKLAGLLLSQWQAQYGIDQHSLIADPLFRDPAKGDFRLSADSPAFKVGFRPFDLSCAGLYGDPEWVRLPEKRLPVRR